MTAKDSCSEVVSAPRGGVQPETLHCQQAAAAADTRSPLGRPPGHGLHPAIVSVTALSRALREDPGQTLVSLRQ